MTLFIKTNSNALTVLETTPLPDLLTVRQTSEILGVGRVSVFKQISAGKLLAVQKARINHIPKSAVIDFLRSREESHK